MFSSASKGMNRLINIGMSNIYLRVPIEKNWLSRGFDFLSLKDLCPGQFLVSSEGNLFNICFASMYNAWNTLSEYTDF